MRHTLLAAAVVLLPFAAGADPQQVALATELAASPEEVWTTIGNFHDMSWHPAVFATEGEGDATPGATRVLTLGEEGGPTISETLDARDEAGMSYSYRITEVDPAVLPVTDYSSTLAVTAREDGGASVTWTGTFEPSEGASDEDAVGAIAGVYQGGLDALTERFGAAE
ncbi:hypothetical protein OCH239_14925 [Roseivivax halodurans JCM 10272]|uniref:SRPBCC family protein n=1 Tax=Roseivivax halodurans JCM 10272 TaxID=1449350 RepID=X7EAB0_9RHOB|nr:SRPBCC family protein [Roseivivax halodurans]ETX13009.1 hypothetical protein OCH239_14925 [Roseivivax halodurans JCM 10272]